MADNKKISDLPDDTSVTLADYIPIVTPGSAQTKKASLARVIALAGTGGSGGTGGGSSVFLDSFVVNLPNNQTGIPNGTTINAGENVTSFLMSAFRKASPAVYNGPSLSLSGNSAPAITEVGTPVSIAFNIAFNKNDAGIENSRALYKNGTLFAPVSGAYSDNIVLTQNPVNYAATVAYAQGGINNDSLGTPDASGRIQAGSINSNTLSYQGYHKVFFGATDAPITSGNLRSVLGNVFLSGSVIDFPSGTSYKHFYVAVPPGRSLATWFDSSASNADLTGALTNSAITIADGGSGTLNYTLYKLTTGAPYSGSGDLFKFSIS